MRPDEIRAPLRKQPFEPIRVYISDGASHDVRHPEVMLVSRSEVVIGLQRRSDAIPDRNVYIDPIHITRIEPINGKSKAKRRRSS